MPRQASVDVPNVEEPVGSTLLPFLKRPDRVELWEAFTQLKFDSLPPVPVAARRKAFRAIARYCKHLGRLAENSLIRPDDEIAKGWEDCKGPILTVLALWLEGDTT